MASGKERMAGDLERLEREVQRASRDLAGTERAASNKLREALGAMQQDELGTRMRRSAEAIRRGLGPYAVMREPVVTQGVNRFRDQLREAEQAMGKGPQQGGDPRLEQALAQAERLRRQLEQAARGKPGRTGDQQAGNHQRAGRMARSAAKANSPVKVSSQARRLAASSPERLPRAANAASSPDKGPKARNRASKPASGRGERQRQRHGEGGNSGREGGSPEYWDFRHEPRRLESAGRWGPPASPSARC